jgi:hypothetical protein
MSEYSRSIPCPGKEFGLEPCEEDFTQRAYSTPGSFEHPGDFIEDEDPDPSCDCAEQLEKQSPDLAKAYWARVWEEIEKKDFEWDQHYSPHGDY